MKKALTIIAAMIAIFGMAQTISYQKTEGKAQRFFDNEEWASAGAMYNFMLRERPQVADTYGKAIVVTEILSDSIRSMQLLNQAMAYDVPLDSVLANVKKYSFLVGRGNLYEHFMLSAAREYKWMGRVLDPYLLRYYAFRRNAPQMVSYAKKMLVSTPANTDFLTILADGYMIDGQFPLAEDTWKKIIDIDPTNYNALLNLACYYHMVGSESTAIEYFRKASAIHRTPYVDSILTEYEKKAAIKQQ